MDSLINAAARALAQGDPFSALKCVALRDHAPALALRGIAMAQLGELTRARVLLRSAVSAFGPKEAVARARCVIAEAEIAIVTRDLAWPVNLIDEARITLEKHGDRINATHALYIKIRRLLLLGSLDDAERELAGLNPARLPPPLRTAHELAVAGIAIRRLQTKVAQSALSRARRAAQHARIPALISEVESASTVMRQPVARLTMRGEAQLLLLEDIEVLLASKTFVIDACRFAVREANTVVSLARRPVLFTLARELGEAWPGDVPRETLIKRAFRSRQIDESYRVRLRVEIARLRQLMRELAGVNATKQGFVLVPRRARKVAVLAHPVEEKHTVVLALLADGEAWSTSALALALKTSQRTVQRALNTLVTEGKVQAFGRGRSRRWRFQPVPGFATTLLLPTTLPSD